MAANYHRPKPVDPLWWRRELLLHLLCRCGHTRRARIDAWLTRFGINPDMNLSEFYMRLTCSRCGERRPTMSFPECRAPPVLGAGNAGASG